jgi:hypothetical protein
MAAIFALIFVPGFAAILFMLGILRDSPSLASGVAAAIFIALAMGVFVGLLRLMRQWEAGDEHRA